MILHILKADFLVINFLNNVGYFESNFICIAFNRTDIFELFLFFPFAVLFSFYPFSGFFGFLTNGDRELFCLNSTSLRIDLPVYSLFDYHSLFKSGLMFRIVETL